MSDKDKDSKAKKGKQAAKKKPAEKTLSKNFKGGEAPDYGDHLFKPSELDVYTNKLTYETYIFHGKIIDYASIDHVVYDHEAYTMTIHHKKGRTMDLGIKMEWLVRPYISKAEEIWIVRTQDGISVDGITVPLKHKGRK